MFFGNEEPGFKLGSVSTMGGKSLILSHGTPDARGKGPKAPRKEGRSHVEALGSRTPALEAPGKRGGVFTTVQNCSSLVRSAPRAATGRARG